MAKSYYKVIDGKNYDRDMLSVAEKAKNRKRGKPLIELDLAKKLFKALADGNEYTDVEKKTMKYIRDNYAFAKDADEYIRTEVRKFAASNRKKTKSNQNNKTSQPNQSNILPEEGEESYDYEAPEDVDVQEDWGSTSYERFSESVESEQGEEDTDNYNSTDDKSGFRELVAYKDIDKEQRKKRRRKIMVRIVLVILFLLMVLGITWTVCKPKSTQSDSTGFETIESSEDNLNSVDSSGEDATDVDSSDLEKDSHPPESLTEKDTISPDNVELNAQKEEVQKESDPLPENKINHAGKNQRDEFAGEPGTAAPIRKIPVDKNNQKSSISYINSLEVTFVRNQEDLTSETKSALQELAVVLKANPKLLVRIQAHTCWIGTKEDNQTLSDKRARLVREFLQNEGVESSQLEAIGYGELSSVATNSTKLGRMRNRRVDFSVLKIRE